MFKLLISFCLLILAANAFSQPVIFNFHGAKQRRINDREFLRSYNMHNINTLAALSRYDDLLDKRIVLRD